jgi:hypothetical protein
MLSLLVSAIGHQEGGMLQARHADRNLRNSGVGLAGLVVASWLLAGCQPGSLPCTKDDEWAAICKGDAAMSNNGGSGNGGSGNGGTGGSSTGGSATGGTGGGTGGSGGGAVTKDTPIANCSAYPTLGKMDDFFAMRCGAANACHNETGGAAWNNFKVADVWKTLKNTATIFACKPGKVIDGTTWDKSVMWRKTRQPGPPMCVEGGLPGTIMPPPGSTPPTPVLTPDEDTCLQGFLKAIAGAQ